jgi:hypothetical protein
MVNHNPYRNEYFWELVVSGLVAGGVIGILFLITALELEEPKRDKLPQGWECDSEVSGECVVMYKIKEKKDE